MSRARGAADAARAAPSRFASLCPSCHPAVLLLALLPAALLLTACGGDDEDPPDLVTEYTITDSGTNLAVGDRVVVLQSGDFSSCGNIVGGQPAVRAGHGVVATAGTVTFNVTRTSVDALLESTFIDKSNNGVLDAGDTVWGTDPSTFVWLCWDFGGRDPVASFTYDWTDDIVGAGGANTGQSTYSGPTFSF